ncbi:F-box/WD repeat-containing protein 12 [Acomys russatus]|uniref:F-box/WD repeat-containing protein 12 n=1 Tax=Acomys russatus TaxID=60746 RepID=UPI0021E217F9|nr:F-box/WD repeat-containing protein 12 [Acomys russatus]
MAFNLPNVPLLKVFSYLDVYSLLQAAQVSKVKTLPLSPLSNRPASCLDSSTLDVCLKRWYCSDVTLEFLGAQTWKQFCLSRTRQEHAKSRAKPEDFIYREIPGDFGFKGHASYLSGSGLTKTGKGKSVVCVVTSTTRLTTWDLKEGVMLWISPVQPTCISQMTTLPEMHLAITVDVEATIKLWNCCDRDAQATNYMSDCCQILNAVITNDGPIVLAADNTGLLYTFRIPDLHLISKIRVFQFPITELRCSPQKKWVFLNKKHPHVLPKVFLIKSLMKPSRYPDPVGVILSFMLCQSAFWTPRREDRLILMSRRGPSRNAKFVTFDMELGKMENKVIVKATEVASFELRGHVSPLECMGVADNNMIVFSSGSCLFVFNMDGLQMQSFQSQTQEILELRVDPIHVIVTFVDGSLEVFAWEERRPFLKSCYSLRHRKLMGQQK